MEEESIKTSENKPERDELGRLLPGNTANPNGRPVFSLVTILKKKLEEISDGDKKTNAELLVDKAMKIAIELGDIAMIKEFFNRVDGMPTQPLEHSGGLVIEVSKQGVDKYVFDSSTSNHS